MAKLSIDRRTLLKQASLLGAATLAIPNAGCADDDEELPTTPQVFLHGVASGDPLSDAVILWTRVTSPDDTAVDVGYRVSSDATMQNVVASGTLQALPETDFTVKVDVTGLDAHSDYFYQFNALEEDSAVGRTRTAPAGDAASLTFGVCSCSNYAGGHFNGYQLIAQQQDIDLVLHLGDYIYEYGNGGENIRQHDPDHEIVALEDYRRRYAQYRSDPDLQAAHQRHPFAIVWDDHEFANNTYKDGAENHTPGSEGEWQMRAAFAQQAHREWMPIREQPDGRIWRRLSYGNLVDLILLDTRYWGRDQQAASPEDPSVNAPERSLLGADQEAWLLDQLSASKAKWRLLGQQVMIGQLPQFLNVDQWDGYPAARGRLYDHLRGNNIDNIVVLTGDIHSSWAMDLTDDPFSADYQSNTGEGSLGVEFVTPGITSPGFGEALAFLAEGLIDESPHLFYADLVKRGYLLVNVDAERVQAHWYHLDDVTTRNGAQQLGATVTVASGSAHVVVDAIL